MSAQQIADNISQEVQDGPVMIDSLNGKPLTNDMATHLKDYVEQATDLTLAISKYMTSTFPKPQFAVIATL